MPKTINAALRDARRRVSIGRIGRGQWEITYRLGRASEPWVQGRTGDWHTIAREASATVATKALEMMVPGMDWFDADLMIRDARENMYPRYAAEDLLKIALRKLSA